MVADRPEHLRFIERTHRRWVAWRVVECAGIAGAVGAGVAMLVVLLLVARAEPAVIPAVWLLGLGVLCGGIWGWTHRPTLLETAILIDKQLKLHDLLSTSMSEQKWADPVFEQIILAQARSACASISPSELVLRRLGSRQWGGIGIAAAMVLTVGLMSGQPTTTQAEAGNVIANSAGSAENAKRTQSAAPSGGDASQPVSQKELTASNEEARQGQDTSRSSGTGRSNIRSADGTGSAAGQTRDSAVASLRQSGSTSESGGDGVTSAGGNSTQSISAGTESGTGQAGRTSSSVIPWQSSTWASDSAGALEKIQNGQIPDTYRDLVREYFFPQK